MSKIGKTIQDIYYLEIWVCKFHKNKLKEIKGIVSGEGKWSNGSGLLYFIPIWLFMCKKELILFMFIKKILNNGYFTFDNIEDHILSRAILL